jgi:hypothetical protein
MNERDKEFARQAGMVYREFEDEFANANTDGVDQETMQRFADLIRANEREACAKVCENQVKIFLSPQYKTGQPLSSFGERHAAASCAAAIRARGNA